MSRTTGALKWVGPYQGNWADYAIDDQHLYVTPYNGDSLLLAYDVDGCGLAVCLPSWWASDNSDESGTTPIVAGDVIYIAGANGIIHAYPADGCGPLGAWLGCSEIASIDTGLGEVGRMSVAEGRLFAASEPSNGTYTVKAFAPVTAP